MPHVDELRVIADYAPDIHASALKDRLCREHEFFIQEFVPHMEIEQAGWLPALELIAARGDVVEPMTHAHEQIHELIDRLGRACGDDVARLDEQWVMEVRRTLYQLYSLLKVHLAEEELQAPLLERELSDAQATGLAAQLEFGQPPARK